VDVIELVNDRKAQWHETVIREFRGHGVKALGKQQTFQHVAATETSISFHAMVQDFLAIEFLPI
jgi:hypothetical protein